jgi:hypothetical protein
MTAAVRRDLLRIGQAMGLLMQVDRPKFAEYLASRECELAPEYREACVEALAMAERVFGPAEDLEEAKGSGA